MADTDAVLEIGLAGQPAPCFISGSKVTFTQTPGNAKLMTEMTLEPGKTAVLDNFAIPLIP